MEHLDDARVLLYRGGRLPDGSWPRSDMPDEEKVEPKLQPSNILLLIRPLRGNDMSLLLL